MDHTMVDAAELADNQAHRSDLISADGPTIAELAQQQNDSLERRMNELSEMIRSWDWRANSQAAEVEYLPPDPPPPPPVPPYEVGQRVFGDEFVLLSEAAQDSAPPPFEPQHAPTPPKGQPAVRRSHPSAPRHWSALSWCVAFLALAVVALVVVGLTQFGPTSHQRSATATAAVRHRAALVPIAERFASISKPADTANVAAEKGLGQLGASATPEQVVPLVTPDAIALAQFDRNLSYIRWPASLKPADTALSATLYETIVHIDSLHSVPATAIGPWLTSYEANVAAVNAAANELRAHLGLPVGP